MSIFAVKLHIGRERGERERESDNGGSSLWNNKLGHFSSMNTASKNQPLPAATARNRIGKSFFYLCTGGHEQCDQIG